MNTRVDPFQVTSDPKTGEHIVTGPNEYNYVLRGARSVEHAQTWALRLNAAYEMGYRAAVEVRNRPILVRIE